jgi:aldose 1-epimerase
MPVVTRSAGPEAPSVSSSFFGTLPDGSRVDRHTIRAGRLELSAITYGGIIMSLRAPDRDGALDDVVLGHDSLEGYLTHSPYFGALIGRCGNRIDQGRFTLDGVQHQLTLNDGPHHLHGGACGFDRMLWIASPFDSMDGAGLTLTRSSADGEQGYPGALAARVTYTLTPADELVIDYTATTDRPTIVNLTQHSYFNLGGARVDDILGHELVIEADAYTPVDAGLIPTGQIAPVEQTPFDFRAPTRIGARVDERHVQLTNAGGYDHNFVLRPEAGTQALRHAARLREPVSGRTLEVRTSEPGLQFYSGNFLDGTIRGRAGRLYGHRGGLCLETQHFPDAPNQKAFPSVTLRPLDTYRSRTVYAFGTEG